MYGGKWDKRPTTAFVCNDEPSGVPSSSEPDGRPVKARRIFSARDCERERWGPLMESVDCEGLPPDALDVVDGV